MNICFILGTRPEIIKMSPIIRWCKHLGLDFFILHSGQHYSYYMDKIFFDQLDLPEAKYNLDVGSGNHSEQTAKMLVGIDRVLCNEQPEVVLVQGDTNTVLAGALAASKLKIKIGHIEAGLRSNDRTMPEELNRILTDHCSDYLFAPTKKSKNILLKEGIPDNQIFVTGNTIVDAVLQNEKLSKTKTDVLKRLNLSNDDYFLVTVHRQENVDNKQRFNGIIEGLQLISNEFDCEIIYPIHPRAKKQLKIFGTQFGGITLVEPLDYLSFLHLEKNAKLVLTDSGGVQEETCILGVPCITLRDNTERPETLDVGSNMLAGTNPSKIVEITEIMFNKKSSWSNPFGDGNAAKRIMDYL